MEYLLGTIVIASALVQGGFYPLVFLACGILLSVLCGAGRRTARPCAAELILWTLALLYPMASLFQGYSAASLAQACLPSCCACFLSCFRSLPGERRERLLQVFLSASAVFAGLGMLSFCGLLHLPEAMTAHRLQFPFQYANAAGSWFAASALLAQEERKPFHLPFIAALVLTRSAGALGLYILCQLLRLWFRRKDSIWQETVLVHAVAAFSSIGIGLLPALPATILVVLLYVAGWKFDAVLLFAQRIHLHWVGLVLGSGGVLFLLFQNRTVSPLATLTERLIQILDGTRLLLTHPFFGVGPGNWGLWYPYVQSAQYVSNVVHSIPIQVGVDAGLPAVLVLAVFPVLAWKRGQRTLAQSLAAGLLLVHSLMDFTIRFFPLAALLLAVLFAKEKEVERSPVLWRLLPLPAGLLCVGMLWGEVQYRQLAYAWQRQDWQAVADRYKAQEAFLGKSYPARELYVRAQGLAGKPEGVLEATNGIDLLTTEEILLRAQALQLLGEEDAACTLLMEQVERQPFCVALYEGTAQLLKEWDVGEEWFLTYNRLVERVREPSSFLVSLMGDQVEIAPIYK